MSKSGKFIKKRDLSDASDATDRIKKKDVNEVASEVSDRRKKRKKAVRTVKNALEHDQINENKSEKKSRKTKPKKELTDTENVDSARDLRNKGRGKPAVFKKIKFLLNPKKASRTAADDYHSSVEDKRTAPDELHNAANDYNTLFEDSRTSSDDSRQSPEDADLLTDKPKEPNAFEIFKVRVKAYRDAHGRTYFEVEGINFGRLLSLLSEITELKKVKTGNKKLTFCAPSKEAGKIIALLDKLCYNHKIIKVRGLVPFSVNFAARIGLVSGILIAVAAVSVYPKLITRITVDGADSAAVREILNGYGLKPGAFVLKLDEKAVSNDILALEGISFASVEKRGSHLYIVIREELAEDNYVDFKGEPVTAKRRASVTRVIVTGGTAVVKYGDVVEPGDMLIDGFVLVGEEKSPVPAGGEVYGKIYHEKTVLFPDVELVKRRGKTKTYTRLGMFGKVPKPPKAPFISYELETSVGKYDFLLPFSVYTYRYTEVSVEERKNTRTEDEMKREVLSSLVASLPPEAKALDYFFEVTRANGGFSVRAVIETEELIS